MSVLSDNYKRILTEIETNITNPEEREFVKEKISELSISFMEAIENIDSKTDERLKLIEEKQKQIENKMYHVESVVNEIESDIYEEDDNDNYDFEIVCPYCNNEFFTEIIEKNEIKCPNCNNIIELDWNEEEENECEGHCCSCHGCGFEDDNKGISNIEENEDDM